MSSEFFNFSCCEIESACFLMFSILSFFAVNACRSSISFEVGDSALATRAVDFDIGRGNVDGIMSSTLFFCAITSRDFAWSCALTTRRSSSAVFSSSFRRCSKFSIRLSNSSEESFRDCEAERSFSFSRRVFSSSASRSEIRFCANRSVSC